MKKVLSILFLIFIGCTSTVKNESDPKRYIEEETPFTDLFYFRIKDNEWIRDPENILMVHETLKKGFYKSFLTPEILDQKPFTLGRSYQNESLRMKIDSLVSSFPNYQSSSKQNRGFWVRRKKEKNDSIVFMVLKEIQGIGIGENQKVQEELVNKKLENMIQLLLDSQEKIDSKTALSHFNFLKKENMHQSAYNLLYENFLYEEVELNRDSLKQLLRFDSAPIERSNQFEVFIMDNTK